MRFALVDRILELELGSRIRAVKSPTLTEEYLQDHFPLFPVMPGVLMLESMYQAAAWLLRVTDDFRYSVVLLREAKNVKYSGFVRPGEQLSVDVQFISREATRATFKASASVGQISAASARLIVDCKNLMDQDPAHAPIDDLIRQRYRRELLALYPQGQSINR